MRSIALASVVALASTRAAAVEVIVEIRGDVFSNQISGGVLGTVSPGETVTYSFVADSDSFIDGAFPTRAYEIDMSSFELIFSGGASIDIDPGFAGPAYFVLRDNDPAVDGFFLSQGPDFPAPIPVDQAGIFGNFGAAFSVSYTGDTLNSLDLVDAFGVYDFDGLKSFNMGINDGPFEGVLGIDFNSMVIVPTPPSAALLAITGIVATRRRR